MPSTQRPYFLSSFLSAFRQQGPSLQTTAQQANKHTTATSSTAATSSTSSHAATAYHQHHHQSSSSPSPSAAPSASSSSPSSSAPRTISASAAAAAAASASHATRSSPSPGVSYHASPRTAAGGIPIPGGASPGHRRGSDSSSEGFREALGADKWYIGGRTAGGEEKFFKLGVVRRVRSNDGLSLDRLSL